MTGEKTLGAIPGQTPLTQVNGKIIWLSRHGKRFVIMP